MSESHIILGGGNLRLSKEKIFKRFLERLPDPEGVVLIIVTSSSSPRETFESLKNTFLSLGISGSKIRCLPLSADESLIREGWRSNGNQADLLSFLENCSGVWFSGGDQLKITRSLLEHFEQPTLFLTSMKERFLKGMAIGGSSAGAAVMSEVMIGSGTDEGALTAPVETDAQLYEAQKKESTGQLLVTKGLGFFPEGIIDQHFNTCARLQRLIRALRFTKTKTGYGISEDTALVYSARTRRVEVVGSAYVTKVEIMDQKVLLSYEYGKGV